MYRTATVRPVTTLLTAATATTPVRTTAVGMIAITATIGITDRRRLPDPGRVSEYLTALALRTGFEDRCWRNGLRNC